MRWLNVLALLAMPAFAAEPIVRATLDQDTVAVGEPVTLTLTVLAPTWFPSPPIYPDFELVNALTRLPPDSSYPTSERIDGDTWSGIVRNYQIFPLLDARFELNGRFMRVTFADPENAMRPNQITVAVPDLAFTATVPAGAEGLAPYIAGRALTLERRVEGAEQALRVGDAVKVEQRARLDGLPAIFIPPLIPADTIPGATLYPHSPTIEDGRPATRTDTFTLIFNQPGRITLPSVEWRWWNAAAEKIETAALPALTFVVIGPAATSSADSVSAVDWRPVAIGLLIAAVAAVGLRRASRIAGQWRKARRDHYLASERFAYHELQAALAANDTHLAYAKALIWLRRIAPETDLRSLAAAHGDAGAPPVIEQFLSSRYGGAEPPAQQALIAAFNTIRRRARRLGVTRHRPALPPLNP